MPPTFRSPFQVGIKAEEQPKEKPMLKHSLGDKLRPFIRETVKVNVEKANPHLATNPKLLNNITHSIIVKGLAPLYL